jgi:hypothetical protein
VSNVLAPSISHRPTTSLWLVLTALVLGLALGGGAVSLTWFVSHHTASAREVVPFTDAGLDAATACADLSRLPMPPSSMLSVVGTPDALARLAGAAALAQTAAAEDAHYQPLSDALTKADRLVEAWHDESSGPQASNALAAARTACVHP